MSRIDIANEVTAVDNIHKAYYDMKNEIGKVIVGQDDVVKSALISIFCNGHCLLVGVPGLAKTLLVQTIASVLDLSFNRIQFTPDLMPSDITGSEILDDQKKFRFVKGPVFANLLLADEINRTPPKTQAALLEAMQERRVTVGGQNYPLPSPFFVVATQNPIELEGTYPLPEAQLERFLFNVILDYLDSEQEVAVINRFTKSVAMPPVKACTTAKEIVRFQSLIREVPISDSLSRYAVDIVRATRPSDELATEMIKKYANFGSSIRATMNLVLAAKTRALMEGRYHVQAEDLRALAIPILRHRVLPNYYAESDGISIDDILADLLTHVPVNE